MMNLCEKTVRITDTDSKNYETEKDFPIPKKPKIRPPESYASGSAAGGTGIIEDCPVAEIPACEGDEPSPQGTGVDCRLQR